MTRDYEHRAEAVSTAVWEIWTKNGLGMDKDEREEAAKSVQDAVANAWVDGLSDAEWQHSALEALGGTANAKA